MMNNIMNIFYKYNKYKYIGSLNTLYSGWLTQKQEDCIIGVYIYYIEILKRGETTYSSNPFNYHLYDNYSNLNDFKSYINANLIINQYVYIFIPIK